MFIFSSCNFSGNGVKMQTMASFRANNHKITYRMLIYGPILTIQSSNEKLGMCLIMWKISCYIFSASNSVITFVIVHYAIISYEDDYLNKIFSFLFQVS